MLTAPSLTEIFVVRHAEVHNPENILYGRLPHFRLSEKGRRQADDVGRFTSARHVAAIYASPLLRARQTAEIISQYHSQLAPRIDRDLIEVRTSYQGHHNSILKPGFSFYDPVNHQDDEKMEDVYARMVAFLRRVIRRHPGQIIVAVSHADPIVIMRLGLQRRGFTNQELHGQVYPDRASVNHLLVGPGQALRIGYFAPGGRQL